ncbi:uncharacterized protein LOC115631501 [Scaptodrosophila lebanonensis]|uniref:Uncharacterized protein LOC115631501 n=1 Tax=Drosophila lebanonensis TaxID=7225 RepID=A0A6J2U6E8_DROLE|nr:uncharacterized protein LOC115631501 [Scaptodrosophila lebanonensis]
MANANGNGNDNPLDVAVMRHAHHHQERQRQAQAAAVIDFKKERDKNATIIAAATTAPNRNQKRLQQLQLAQGAATTGGNNNNNIRRHHHLRHEQHLLAELEANRQQQQQQQQRLQPSLSLGGGQQHHLRHHNRHHADWEQRVFQQQQQLLQQQILAQTTTSTIASPSTATTTTTDAPYKQRVGNQSSVVSRYFDREGIFAWSDQRTTRAPKWQTQQQRVGSADTDDYGNDDDSNSDDEDDEGDDYESDDDYSDEVDTGSKQMPRYSLFTHGTAQIRSDNSQNSDTIEDYVYESNDGAAGEKPSSQSLTDNKHPSVGESNAKAAAKRNIFDWLFKKDKQQEKAKPIPLQATTAGYEKLNSNNDESFPNAKQVDSAADEEDDDEDSAEGFSNDQWNKIQHEHHLKHQKQQQKHQKELLALRESSRNTPLIRNTGGSSSTFDFDNEFLANDENIYSRNYLPGKLTNRKVEQLGTAEAVKKARRLHVQQRDRDLAKAHFNQVINEANCRVPQRRCESIQRDPSKIYSPHCTILHRCSEDSGCCHSRSQVCAPKRTNNVELYFFVKSNNQLRPVTEKLTFVNHTECHCVERSKYAADGGVSSAVLQRATILSCTCPKPFEKILQDDGFCRCDCSSGNYGCDWLKRGSEHFSITDRKCIQQGRCKPPTCEYGTYIEKHGRCPKQHEQMPQLPSYNVLS